MFKQAFRWTLIGMVAAAVSWAPASVGAEEEEAPPIGWSQSLVGGLSFTQTEFENYAQGGESSLTWTSLLTYVAREYHEKRDWKTEVEAQFGQSKLGSGDIRKAVDKLKLASLHTWTLGAFVDPYVSLDARTQFAKGYAYYGDNERLEVSRFANPFYLAQGAGVGKQLLPGLRTRLGVSVQEVFVTKEEFAAVIEPEAGVTLRYTDDPETDKIEKTRVDTGIESVTDYERSFDEGRLNLKSELKLFSQFEDPSVVDVYWNNKATAQVLSFISVILETELLYDADIVKRTQFKEVLSIGLTHKFF